MEKMIIKITENELRRAIRKSILNEYETEYEPLSSDSAFDFQSEVFDVALAKIKKRLLDKRGQNAYDGIGSMIYFLEKNLGDCPLFLEDHDKHYDDAVKQAFKTARGDNDWINSWKDPKMLRISIDMAEKKYEDLKAMYLVLYKKKANAITIDENRLHETVKSRLLAEYYNSINADAIDNINYRIDSVPDDDDIAEAVQDEFEDQNVSDIEKISFIKNFVTGNTVYSLECGNYDYHDEYFDGTFDEIAELFGNGIAKAISAEFNQTIMNLPVQDLNYDNLHRIAGLIDGNLEDILSGQYDDEQPDFSDPETANRILKAKFKNNPAADSEWLLTDGEIVAMADHVYVSAVDQTKASFMNLGNIRVGHGSIGMMKKPSSEQLSVIRDVICPRYEDSSLEVHFCTYREGDREPRPDHIVTYHNAASSIGRRRVVNDIINYYNDGIKPQDEWFD